MKAASESGAGKWQYEDPKRLEENSGDQTDKQSTPAPFRNRTTVETPPGEAATSAEMPAANTPDTGNHSQPAEEAG